jgi:hypothetical protein
MCEAQQVAAESRSSGLTLFQEKENEARRVINPGPSTDFEEGRWLIGFESPWFLARAEEKRYCDRVAVCY